MDEIILYELKETRKLLQDIQNSKEQNENRIIQMLSNIEGRLYSIEEKANWIKNGSKHLGDAKGPAGVPGL